jgi:predicted ATPase
MLRAVHFNSFPPFGEFLLKLDPVESRPNELAEVHLFTGVNGTGKTRLLAILAAILGNRGPLTKRLKGGGVAQVKVTDISGSLSTQGANWSLLDADERNTNWRANTVLAQWCNSVPAFAYGGTPYVSDAPVTAMSEVPKPDRATCLSFNRVEDQSKILLQAITNLKLQSAMDSMNESSENPITSRATLIVKALESTIAKITGFKFLFHVTAYPKTSLVVRWAGAELAFDVLPDGLRSIIGWLAHALVMMDVWLQGKSDPMQAEAVFLLDEIESSLHPAWQRKILPAFQALFPNSQIFVASHSPFLIASLNHGWIHPLTMGADGKVTFNEAVPASEGDSYISVVEDIMGLKEWFDPETEKLLKEFRTHRDAAYRGDAGAHAQARGLAAEIAGRSMELEYLMGRELRQMDRQLSKAQAKQ